MSTTTVQRPPHRHPPSQNAERADPTGTGPIQDQYEDALVGWFEELKAVIDDHSFTAFNTAVDIAINQVESPPTVFEFQTDDEKLRAFMTWLRGQEAAGILRRIRRDENTYIRSAYSEGVRHAEQALQAEGYDVDELQLIFNQPVHQTAVQQLFTRNFLELRGITEAMDQRISRVLSAGYTRGYGTEKIARNIREEIDDIGIRRTRLLVRSEIVRTHQVSSLRRYEQAGIEGVTVTAELLTAGDRRVCPICRSISGTTYTPRQARTGTFEFQASSDAPPSLSGEYSLVLPHPGCRCSWIPSVS